MILCSTVRKLAANGATIYRVTYSSGDSFYGQPVPEWSDYFATRAAADSWSHHARNLHNGTAFHADLK